jgi:hypothetical protein
MSDDTEITEETVEETASEETAAEKSIEETASEDKSEDKSEAQTAGADDGAGKDTKVLLSDDGDDGAGGAVDYTFTPPDGVDIEMTDDVVAQFDHFKERAKAVDLTQDQYQELVAGEIERGREAMMKMATDYQQRVEGWTAATKADKELGGDKLPEILATAKLGMDTYGSPELKDLFAMPSEKNPTGLGLGSHPEVIRLLHRAGLTAKEDGNLISGDGGKAESDAALRRMYPSMFKDEAA